MNFTHYQSTSAFFCSSSIHLLKKSYNPKSGNFFEKMPPVPKNPKNDEFIFWKWVTACVFQKTCHFCKDKLHYSRTTTLDSLLGAKITKVLKIKKILKSSFGVNVILLISCTVVKKPTVGHSRQCDLSTLLSRSSGPCITQQPTTQ